MCIRDSGIQCEADHEINGSEEKIMEALYTSPYFGVALSVIAFGAGVRIQQKTKSALCNPLIIAIVLIIGVLLVFKIPYDSYNNGGEIINMFLAPATACLAVSIYTKLSILKKYWLPIIVGCIAGSLASMASVYGMCRLFRLDPVSYTHLQWQRFCSNCGS